MRIVVSFVILIVSSVLIYLILAIFAPLKHIESPDFYKVKIGDIVTLKSGFYKGCKGIIVRYIHYNHTDDLITLQLVRCGNSVTMPSLNVDAKDLNEN